MKDHVYMMVTDDDLELPIAVADTADELAKIVGSTKNSIISSISHARSGRKKKSRYRKVEFEEGE